jgi:glycine/D-amino acid oxidase-like deaminating enzyme/nitrite reductase/ring-hydroxylating ferredoxin subunit
MERDGTCTSLWQYDIPQYQSAYTTIPDTFFDIVIVGGGITGVSVAHIFQKAGKKCLLLEAHSLGYGTTSGTTAHLNTIMDSPYSQTEKNFGEKNAQLVAEIARRSIEHIKQNINEYSIDCGFEELPAYLFSQDEKQTKELDDITEASIKAGVSIEYVNDMPVRIPFKKAIRIEQQAKFHPTQYLLALAKAFEEAGGIIVQNCRVLNAEKNEEVVDVQTSLGKVQAGQLIYATHIPPGINLLHLRCAPYRSYVLAVRLANDDYPDGLAYDMYEPYHYYRTQEVKGKKYLIAGGEDHKTAHEENTEACFSRLESHIRKYFDVETIAFKWSSQYFEPADGLPYIGHLPGHSKNIYVATGYGGNGMTYSTVAALVLKDLLLNGSGTYTDLFSPSRIKPVAGFGKLVKENLDVAKELIGKILPAEKLEELADLAYGEAKVVKYGGHNIALYKDEQGNLHAVNPVCTHLKCTVSWNMSEKTWDCPCHGSRFDCEGKVVTGPATKDLEKAELRELINETEENK